MPDDKKNLHATDGVADLLNMGKTEGYKSEDSVAAEASSERDTGGSAINYAEKSVTAPSNLPIAESSISELPKELQPVEPVEIKPEGEISAKDFETASLKSMPDLSQPATRTFGGVIKSILPYIAIFGIGIGLYFFYFSDFSFNNLFSDNLRLESLTADDRDKNVAQIKEDVRADYNVWISQFFVGVNDESIISMDTDVSGNGLTNLEKYLLNLNPKVYSTQGGQSDGQMVISDINPWTGKPFTEKQKELVDKYIYKELISNRITAAAITRGVTKFAQYVTEDSPYYIDPQTLAQVGGNGNVVVNPPQIPMGGNSPGNSGLEQVTPPPAQTPSTPTTLRPEQGIDTSKPGLLEIPANRISVPIIWTKEVKDFDEDLKRGIVHYPGTAMPGEVGLSYISGHSSGYVWDRSPYKEVFAILGQVTDGTSFTITATQNNGQTVRFNYVVIGRAEYAANDQAQFVSTAESQVALSTCWPVGTVDRRLVLYAQLTQTER
jgi:LPXTG-site transpeptidase (sortase) family protein